MTVIFFDVVEQVCMTFLKVESVESVSVGRHTWCVTFLPDVGCSPEYFSAKRYKLLRVVI